MSGCVQVQKCGPFPRRTRVSRTRSFAGSPPPLSPRRSVPWERFSPRPPPPLPVQAVAPMQRPACCYRATTRAPTAGRGREGRCGRTLSAGVASRVRSCLIALFILKALLLPPVCAEACVCVCVCMHAVDLLRRKGRVVSTPGGATPPLARRRFVLFCFSSRAPEGAPPPSSSSTPPPPLFYVFEQTFRREKRCSPWACSVVRATIASPPLCAGAF